MQLSYLTQVIYKVYHKPIIIMIIIIIFFVVGTCLLRTEAIQKTNRNQRKQKNNKSTQTFHNGKFSHGNVPLVVEDAH
jgi:phosphotransferase system  glucose/maltose/N-acetylglucosamine-specific IIC component